MDKYAMHEVEVLVLKDVWSPAVLTGVFQLKHDYKPQVNGCSAGNRAHVSAVRKTHQRTHFQSILLRN